MRTTFLVGRLTPKSTEMVVVNRLHGRSPIPGPWTVRAVVRPFDSPLPPVEPSPTVH